MKKNLIFELLAAGFLVEIENEVSIEENCLIVDLTNNLKVKISAKY